MMMKLNGLAAVAATVGILAGAGLTHHSAAALHAARPQTASSHPLAASTAPAADPSVVWLESAGGQAQVTFNNDVSILAGALETESHAPTVANHLVFEADARVVRAQARQILAAPALLPAVQRAGYEHMLNDFIVVGNLLQPGPGYGTTSQDYTAWYAALQASNINVA
jgi:hypothetical protein